MTLEELKTKLTIKPSQVLEKYDWTQNAYARNKNGRCVHPVKPSACAFCAFGAIEKAIQLSGAKIKNVEQLLDSVEYLEKLMGVKGLAIWNDDPKRTKKQVINAFKKVGL